jgi:hypothetical protein
MVSPWRKRHRPQPPSGMAVAVVILANPVICSAMIKKCDVFSASVDREEQELVVDYKKLLNLRVVSVHDIAKA